MSEALYFACGIASAFAEDLHAGEHLPKQKQAGSFPELGMHILPGPLFDMGVNRHYVISENLPTQEQKLGSCSQQNAELARLIQKDSSKIYLLLPMTTSRSCSFQLHWGSFHSWAKGQFLMKTASGRLDENITRAMA